MTLPLLIHTTSAWPHGATPVSYTHLDVYKRQDDEYGWEVILGTPGGDHPFKIVIAKATTIGSI